MTQQEYTANLLTIARENPTEPLLATLKGGYSRLNVVYMRAALERLEETDEIPPIEANDDENDERSDDPRWNELTRGIREGYNEVRRVHNLYFGCKTPGDFVQVATQMREAWDATQRAISARKAYELGGFSEEETDEIPENPALLAKMLNSLRVKRTQHQNKIVELAKAGDTQKLKAKEASLAKIKIQIGIVEQRLREHEKGIS